MTPDELVHGPDDVVDTVGRDGILDERDAVVARQAADGGIDRTTELGGLVGWTLYRIVGRYA